MLGLTVFVLVWFRLFARSIGPAPKIFPASPHWQTRAGQTDALGAVPFHDRMPILGWLITSAEGHQVMFYGFDLPLLVRRTRHLPSRSRTGMS